MTVTRVPKQGDRSAYNTTDAPDLHASDIEDETFIYHRNPSETPSAAVIVTLLTREGEVAVEASPLIIRNLWGYDRVIEKILVIAGTGPTGDDLIVNVKINGSSITTSPNRATIADGDTEGETTTFSSPNWNSDQDLTWEITQIGSTIPGSNITVHIVHNRA